MKRLTSLLFFITLLGCTGESASEQPLQSIQKEESSVFGLFGSKETKNYVIASPLSGVLVQDGKPLVHTKIIRRLTWNGNEAGVVDEFTTDEKGAFSIPVYEKELTLNTMTEFVAAFKLYAREEKLENFFWYSPKRDEDLYSDTGGILDEMICDINNEEDRVNVTSSGVLTKCKWKGMP